jgi:pimeloyl-ACP methyl ester carboxylesterase
MQRSGAVEYETHGTGDAVLCIHGAIVADSFAPLMEETTLAGYRLIRYRRRGYGDSDPPAGAPTIAEQVGDALALLQDLQVTRTHVVAHSGGGPIAVQLALDAPAVVHSLVLLEPVLQNAATAVTFHELITPLIEMHRRGESGKAVHMWMRLGSAGSAWGDELERRIPGAVDQANLDAAGTFDWDLEALRHWDFDAVGANGITQPVLHIEGSLSAPFRQPMRDRLFAALPDTEDVTIPDVDHSLQMTEPSQVASVIADFLHRHPLPN